MKIDPRKKVRHVAGEDIVVMQADGMADMTRVVAFNESALMLYNRLKDREFTLDDAVQALLNEYDVDAETARRDAAEWLQTMNDNGMLL